jgi:hypothetical protein
MMAREALHKLIDEIEQSTVGPADIDYGLLDALYNQFSEELEAELTQAIVRCSIEVQRGNIAYKEGFRDIISEIINRHRMKEFASYSKTYNSRRHQEGEEMLESLELEGFNVDRLPEYMNPSGLKSWRFISTAELSKESFSRYSLPRLSALAKTKKIHSFELNGKNFVSGIGVLQLMERELASDQIGTNKGGGRKPSSQSNGVPTNTPTAAPRLRPI